VALGTASRFPGLHQSCPQSRSSTWGIARRAPTLRPVNRAIPLPANQLFLNLTSLISYAASLFGSRDAPAETLQPAPLPSLAGAALDEFSHLFHLEL